MAPVALPATPAAGTGEPGSRLYFSDWSAGEVVAVDLAGRSEVIAKVDSIPLCTAWLPDSRLVIVSSSQGQLLRLEPDGSLVTHADLGGPGWNDIVADGRLSNRRIWAELGDGTPDGICADAQDAIWYADVPGRRCVRVAEGGTVLQTVNLDRGGFACTLGGPERTTLLIVAATWQGMTQSEMVAPASGQVQFTPVDTPDAGWP